MANTLEGTRTNRTTDPLFDTLRQICTSFRIPGKFLSYDEIKVGNVNRTYKVNFQQPCQADAANDASDARSDAPCKSYMIQRINTYAFKEPVKVMENIDKVTEHIRAKRPDKVSLHFHHTADRKNYVSDEHGFWRLFNYVPSVTYNTTEKLSVIRNAGEAFGEFQMLLGDFDVALLHETIPDFHNTRKRYAKLEEDVRNDPLSKVKEVRAELDWLLLVKEQACRLTDMQQRSELPLRVTHNDTKINNVLFDADTDKALVVIDLDTVMPGLVGHDFGDAIRFAANYVSEDSPEAEKAGVNMEVFRAFTEGFLKQTAATLTQAEIDTLGISCFALACELATRFLDDYILGSPYFKIDYPEHNLVRTRCQIALAKDMLARMDEMENLVRACTGR